MFSPELLALAPGYSDAMRALADGKRPRRRRLDLVSVIGVVQLLGPLDKPELVRAREKINQYAADDRVGEIVIIVDSPGGTVAGTHDLHLAIANAAKQKRVTAVCEDLTASAAYWAICGASEIVVNQTGKVGSIGVYLAFLDTSRLLEKTGIDVVIIRSGPHKGTGTSGAKISSQELEQLQSEVDEMARHFTTAIARGRNLSLPRVRDLADGRIWIGNQAIAAGLVDRIGTVEDVLDEAEERLRRMIYAQLEGIEAAEKFDELVADCIRKHHRVDPNTCAHSTRVAAEASIGREFPELAKTVGTLRDKKRADEQREAQERFRRNGGY